MIKNILIFSLKIWIIEICTILLNFQKKKSFLRVDNLDKFKNIKKRELRMSLQYLIMEMIFQKSI